MVSVLSAITSELFMLPTFYLKLTVHLISVHYWMGHRFPQSFGIRYKQKKLCAALHLEHSNTETIDEF